MLSCFFIAKMATLVHLWKTMKFWQGEGDRGLGGEREEKNQSPKGIMRSAVPFPCFFDDMKSREGSRAAAPTGDKVL